MEFYNVKKRVKVQIDIKKCIKQTLSRKTTKGAIRTSYVVKAVDDDGTKLTAFVSKEKYDSLNI